MRGGIVAAGVIILIIGVILLFYGYSMLQRYGQWGIWGEILQALSPEVRQAVEQLRIMTLLGIILSIIGFFTAVAGLAAKPKS